MEQLGLQDFGSTAADRLLARLDQLEATLLSGFRECTFKIEAALETQQRLMASLEERLAALEARVDDMERLSSARPVRSKRSVNAAKLVRSPSIQ